VVPNCDVVLKGVMLGQKHLQNPGYASSRRSMNDWQIAASEKLQGGEQGSCV
jgi:hypothetical protein